MLKVLWSIVLTLLVGFGIIHLATTVPIQYKISEEFSASKDHISKKLDYENIDRKMVIPPDGYEYDIKIARCYGGTNIIFEGPILDASIDVYGNVRLKRLSGKDFIITKATCIIQ